jgi:hypothetical protein
MKRILIAHAQHPSMLCPLLTIDSGVMWAATTNRIVQLTRDGGAHWQKVTPPGIAAPTEIFYVEPSHHDAATAYVSVGSSRQAVPPQIFARATSAPPGNPSLPACLPMKACAWFAKTLCARAFFLPEPIPLSFFHYDDGDHWHPLTLDLPATPVTDMEVHGDDLVISTYGRGLWILDNITPIRQLSPRCSLRRPPLRACARASRSLGYKPGHAVAH